MSDTRHSQLEMFDDFENQVAQAEGTIVRTYARSLIEFNRYIRDIFDSYEVDGVLTMDVMRRYGRLNRMDEVLRGLTVSLYSENTRIISSALNAAYNDGFTGTGQTINRAQRSLHGIIREDELLRAMNNDISGLTWATRNNINREVAASKIRETIVQGLHKGETYAQMAERLNEALGRSNVGSIRIIRTECYRVFSEARKDRLDRIRGIDMTKEWITGKDERVRATEKANHKVMHGIIVPYHKDFMLPNGNSGFAPGMIGEAVDDINCRCFWIVDMADD